ncbi:MAG: tyrosine--tRNA ligase [Candidatus Brocadiaceae bacterium]|nr:tyrosine--tRNA ligase [Candidatus Brocadiaceae bacterium]
MSDITVPVEEQMARIRRGAAQIVPEAELANKLERSLRQGRPLRVKLGLDPTAPDIHIGFAVALRNLRTFQDLGHRAVLIIGDYTAMVGDPSGQNATRPQLTYEQVTEHGRTYLEQVGKVVDLDRAEVARNGDWFRTMSFAEVIALAAKLTVARCIERDDFSKRIAEGRPIGLHELLYPLMQAYDSVMVRSDVELGGTDQTFNILLGRELQRQVGQEPQVAVTNPLLEGLDGVQKMSKSKGNYIGISEPPETIFSKAMSIPDELMEKYFLLATDLPQDRVALMLSPDVHPREAKAELAAAIVRLYYDEEAAERGRRMFDAVFRDRELPEEMPEVRVPAGELRDGAVWIVGLLRLVGAAGSGGEARRLVVQGGVSLGRDADSLEVVADPDAHVRVPAGTVLKVGKRRFWRLQPGGTGPAS